MSLRHTLRHFDRAKALHAEGTPQSRHKARMHDIRGKQLLAFGSIFEERIRKLYSQLHRENTLNDEPKMNELRALLKHRFCVWKHDQKIAEQLPKWEIVYEQLKEESEDGIIRALLAIGQQEKQKIISSRTPTIEEVSLTSHKWEEVKEYTEIHDRHLPYYLLEIDYTDGGDEDTSLQKEIEKYQRLISEHYVSYLGLSLIEQFPSKTVHW